MLIYIFREGNLAFRVVCNDNGVYVIFLVDLKWSYGNCKAFFVISGIDIFFYIILIYFIYVYF